MATIAINYSEMGNAARDAEKVAQKLITYANAINNTVLNKLNNYSGDRTCNISSAVNNARNKKNQLEEDSRRYSNYSTDLNNLKSDCESTDKRVADRVKSLTGTFKDSHGIKTNAILDGLNNFMTNLANSNPAFRWIDNNIVDRVREGRDYLKDKIKEWYNYEGGKQLIKGVGVAALEIAEAVATIVLTLAGTITGIGAIILAAAVVIGAVLQAADGVMNLINEVGAYSARQNGNASMGYRLSKLDTYTDSLRTFSDDKRAHQFANALDVVKVVCDVINFTHDAVDAFKKLPTIFKNGKTMFMHAKDWAANGINTIKSRGFLTVSGELFQSARTRTLDGLGNIRSGIRNMGTALRNRDFDFFRVPISDSFTDFNNSLIENFTNDFLDFSSNEKSLKSINKIYDFGKEVFKADSKSDLLGVVADEFIFPNIEVDFIKNRSLKYDTTTGLLMIGQDGKLTWNVENASLKDIADKFKDTFEFGKKTGQFALDKIKENDMVSDGLDICSGFKDLVENFSTLHNTNISIPKIYVPQIDIQININIQPISIPSGLAA